MLIRDKFRVPDYYGNFVCKGGECRHTCCSGLTISITRNEFFRLAGAECSPELRRALDCSLKIREDADEMKYAVLSPDWLGNCHMLNRDGFCMLQAECGENILSAPCRYYPRSIQTKYGESSCGNGCEKTVELLLLCRNKLSFDYAELEFELPAIEECPDIQAAKERVELHLEIIGLMQDRTVSVAQRIENIGTLLQTEPDGSINFRKVLGLMEWCSREYPELEYLVKNAVQLFSPYGSAEEPEFRWRHICNIFPDMDIYMEQLLVNDIYHVFAPFSDDRLDRKDEYRAIKIIYTMLILFFSADLNEDSDIPDIVDICVPFFRAVENTAFRYNMLVLLNDDNGGDNDNDNDSGNAA